MGEAYIKYSVAFQNLGQQQFQLDSTQKNLKYLETELTDWNNAKILLELLKNFKLEKRKDFILKVINQAMLDIFESNYRLDIQPRDTKGKSAASTQKYDIIFYQNDIEIARNDELLRSNGGGVLSIASLFFKILIGYLYSKNKFYIFDEALSQVSPQYRKRLSVFLKKFCNEYGFTLVVVSQTEELEEHADLVYEVEADVEENGVPILNIANVVGDFPKEDYFYTVIKNFQSIRDQTFIFKGFTIIRGPNNSGKSASLRAIEAVLFNNFKTETYPRKNPGGKKLTTEITFGFEGKEGTPGKEIGLKYKSGKVMFVIEGEEYFGKSLAADKVREAVEEIGFKYIDVKKMYKNFKGDLKEQTERIAYTNQYDGLFLIGAKTSDSEKIFSFLFNTENIALAIARAKERMQELSKEHKKAEEEEIELQRQIRVSKIEMKLYLNKHYVNLIHEFGTGAQNFNTCTQSLTTGIKLTQKLRDLILIDEAQNFNNALKLSESGIQNKKIRNNTSTQKIHEIINLITWSTILGTYLNNNRSRRQVQSKHQKSIELQHKLSGVQDILNFNKIWAQITLTNQKLETHLDHLHDLNNEFNLCECQTCSGKGVIPAS